MIEMGSDAGTEHDVDAIISSAYGTPNSAQADTPSKQPEPQAPAAPEYKEYEFNSRGNAVKIKENDPRFQQWLSQGHDYAQNINSFRNERQNWENQKQDWESKWSAYREIDQFALQNPDWWSHVDQSYKQKLSNPIDIPEPVKQYLDPIIKDYSMVKGFVQEYQREKIQKEIADQDATLDRTIKSIQAQHKDLDFSSKDESGLSLEQRILDFAGKKAISDFEIAFKAYYHDQAVKQAEARGRESIMQEMQKRKKMGILDDNASSTNAQNSAPIFGNGAKPRGWNDPSMSGDSILKEFKFA